MPPVFRSKHNLTKVPSANDPYIIGSLSDGTPILSNDERVQKGYTCEMIDRFQYLITIGYTAKMLELHIEIENRKKQNVHVIPAPNFRISSSETSEMSDYYEYYGH